MASKGPIYFDEPDSSEDDSGEDQPLGDDEVVSGIFKCFFLYPTARYL
jgi:hypothetical protein